MNNKSIPMLLGIILSFLQCVYGDKIIQKDVSNSKASTIQEDFFLEPEDKRVVFDFQRVRPGRTYTFTLEINSHNFPKASGARSKILHMYPEGKIIEFDKERLVIEYKALELPSHGLPITIYVDANNSERADYSYCLESDEIAYKKKTKKLMVEIAKKEIEHFTSSLSNKFGILPIGEINKQDGKIYPTQEIVKFYEESAMHMLQLSLESDSEF